MSIFRVVFGVALMLAAIYWLFMSAYSQIFGMYPYRGKTRKKVIALTFDDGPNEPYTTELADFLQSKHIRATFFQIGVCVLRAQAVTQRLYKDGHVIANHSLNHEFRNYFISLSFKEQITATQDIIEKTIGKRPALYRSPWLWRQPWLLRTLKKYQLQPVSGEFCHNLEVARISPERIARGALRKARPGAIIIFHDGVESRVGDRANTVAAVKLTVEELLNRGYKFVTVDELLSVPAYQN